MRGGLRLTIIPIQAELLVQSEGCVNLAVRGRRLSNSTKDAV